MRTATEGGGGGAARVRSAVTSARLLESLSIKITIAALERIKYRTGRRQLSRRHCSVTIYGGTRVSFAVVDLKDSQETLEKT